MLVAMEPGLEAAPAVTDAVEHEHPSAAQAKRLPTAGVSVDRVHDPESECDKGQADDPTHQRVEPIRQERPEGQSGNPKHDDDRPVAQGIQRAKTDRIHLAGNESGPTHRRPCGQSGGKRGSAGASIVSSDLNVATVPVLVAHHRPMLVGVCGHRHAGSRGRARDVGDRRDVVPIDTVANA